MTERNETVWLISTILGKPIPVPRWCAPLDQCQGPDGPMRALVFASEAEAAAYMQEHP